MIAIILALWIAIIAFATLGTASKSFGIKFLSYSFAAIELVLMFGILYVNEANESILGLLKINFMVMAIVGFGLAMIGLFMLSLRIAVPESEMDHEEGKKWQGKGQW